MRRLLLFAGVAYDSAASDSCGARYTRKSVHRIVVSRAAFKDIPGGQVLGPTLDYAHRILATDVLTGATFQPVPVDPASTPSPAQQPSVAAWQAENNLLTAPTTDTAIGNDIPDVTREPLLFPAKRAHTLQSLARAETGGVLALGYAAQRGYGQAHPTVNELRLAEADIRVRPSARDGLQCRSGQGQPSRGRVQEGYRTGARVCRKRWDGTRSR